MTYYVLNNNKQPVVTDVVRWSEFFADMDRRRVARTELDADVSVSTVFLGMDHQWGQGPPLLFETMIFGGPDDSWCERYSTWAEAEAGHCAIVAQLRAGRPLSGLEGGEQR